MEKFIEGEIERSELLDRAEKLTAKFPNKELALSYYLNEIEKLSSKYTLTISELVSKAENGPMNEDFSYTLSLTRKIQFLKNSK